MTRPPTTPRWRLDFHDVPVALHTWERQVMLVGSHGTAVTVDTDTGTRHHQTSCENGLLGAALAPGQSSALLAGPFGARIWNWAAPSSVAVAMGLWCAAASWIAGNRIAVAAGRRIVVVDHLGLESWRSTAMSSTVTDLAWLGKRGLLAAAANGRICLFALGEEDALHVLLVEGSVVKLAVTANEQWLAAGMQDGSVQLFRLGNKDALADTEHLEMAGYPFKVSRLAFDRSGRFLANDGAPEISIWDLSAPGPRARASMVCSSKMDSKAEALAWHPAQSLLAIGWGHGVVEVFDANLGQPGHLLHASPCELQIGDGVTSLTWGSDGRSLLVGTTGGSVLMFDVSLPSSEAPPYRSNSPSGPHQ